MLPILLSIGPVKIYSMGVLVAVGIFLSLYWWWKMGRDEHWEEIELFDTYFLALFAFAVFGRVAYVLLNWGEMGTLYRALAVLAFPGFNILAGVLGSCGAMWLAAREHEWDKYKMFDAWAVVVGVAAVFFALGGLLDGASGVAALDWWGVGWAVITFAILSKVRKSFRFYAWYKGNASVARDGLTAFLASGLIGVWGVGGGIILTNWFYLGGGLVVILLSMVAIYHNIGHRENIWVNLLQWIKLRRK